MDYAKISPDLALSLQDVAWDAPELEVFVHAENPSEAIAVAREIGIETRPTGDGFSARVSPQQIEGMTDSPAIRSVELSGTSRLLAAW